MLNRGRKLALFFLAGVLVLAGPAFVWGTGAGSSEAQQDAMHNCPAVGRWSIATWSGQYAIPIGEALASCSQQVEIAYRMNPATQAWTRYLRNRPEISNLVALDDGQGIISLGAGASSADEMPGWPQSGESGRTSGGALEDDVTSGCDGNGDGVPNPAAVYCVELAYELTIVDTDEGQHGVCVFPDGSECEEWAFLQGKCGESHSYCARHGYDQITKTGGEDPYSSEYSVCVQDQEEIGPVTELMGFMHRYECTSTAMLGCPAPGKWAISVWTGDSGTITEQAVASCTEATVAAAYWLDPETQAWKRYFDGRPEISDLTTLEHMQGIIALGGTEAPPSPTPTGTPTSGP